MDTYRVKCCYCLKEFNTTFSNIGEATICPFCHKEIVIPEPLSGSNIPPISQRSSEVTLKTTQLTSQDLTRPIEFSGTSDTMKTTLSFSPKESLYADKSTIYSSSTSYNENLNNRTSKLSSHDSPCPLSSSTSKTILPEWNFDKWMLSINLLIVSVIVIIGFVCYPIGQRIATKSPRILLTTNSSLIEEPNPQLETLFSYSDDQIHKAIEIAREFLLSLINQANQLKTNSTKQLEYIIDALDQIGFSNTNRPYPVGIPQPIKQALLIRFVPEKPIRAGYIGIKVVYTNQTWLVDGIEAREGTNQYSLQGNPFQ